MNPIRNNIVFKPFPPKEITSGGLIVPESVRQTRDKGTIVSKGAWVKGYDVGDVVHRVHNWGEEVMIDNEKCYLMDASALLAKDEK